jgi:hypothetical protein
VFYASFTYQAQSWSKSRRVVAKVECHQGELYPRVGFVVTNLTRPAERVSKFYTPRHHCPFFDGWSPPRLGRNTLVAHTPTIPHCPYQGPNTDYRTRWSSWARRSRSERRAVRPLPRPCVQGASIGGRLAGRNRRPSPRPGLDGRMGGSPRQAAREVPGPALLDFSFHGRGGRRVTGAGGVDLRARGPRATGMKGRAILPLAGAAAGGAAS